MNEVYLDIHLGVPPDELTRDIIPAAMIGLGFEGFLEDDQGIHCYIKKNDWKDSIEKIIKDIAEEYRIRSITHLSTTHISNKNWNEEWEKTIQPIAVSEKIIITPSWHPVSDEHSLVLVIDPKMTFGTGYHESTRIMLRLMERYITPGSRVLDVGTGTGILAIAAVKLGAEHVVAIDIDEWTLENGMENAKKNNVADKIDIRIGSMETVTAESFSMVLANIIRNTIIEIMDDLLSSISNDGYILLSGLLTSDRESIESSLLQRNFSVIEVLQENDWIGIVASKK